MVEGRTAKDYIISCLSYVIMTVFALLTLLPFVNIIAKSMSGTSAVISGQVFLWPVDFTVDTFRFILKEGTFFSAFGVSVVVTLVGTVCALVITATTAYPLSRSGFRGRKLFLYLWIFVMLFNGGMIPNYLLYKSLNLTNTLGALILPGMVSVFNMLIIKNYFETLPDSLEEAARIDGANNLRVLAQIILPVSLPMLATISLFYAVGYWNEYFNARLYISDPKVKPLQLYLYELITQSLRAVEEGIDAQSTAVEDRMNVTPDSVRSAAILLSTVPILLVYPYLQRYFISGIVIGSVKG